MEIALRHTKKDRRKSKLKYNITQVNFSYKLNTKTIIEKRYTYNTSQTQFPVTTLHDQTCHRKKIYLYIIIHLCISTTITLIHMNIEYKLSLDISPMGCMDTKILDGLDWEQFEPTIYLTHMFAFEKNNYQSFGRVIRSNPSLHPHKKK